MRTVCAWCLKNSGRTTIIKPDDGKGGTDSHGICQECWDEVIRRNRETMLREIAADR